MELKIAKSADLDEEWLTAELVVVLWGTFGEPYSGDNKGEARDDLWETLRLQPPYAQARGPRVQFVVFAGY